jgi:hypothetical protein
MSVESSGVQEFALRARARAPAMTRLAAKAGFLLLAAYCALLVLLSPVPVQDFPDHLARAVAMSDLMFHGGARFGDIYQFHLLWIPYLLGDLILTGAVELFGPIGGGAFWTLLVFLSFPLAAIYYLRVRGFEASDRVLMLLLALYLATDWFFLMGFWSFRVSVAMLIATLAMVELLRREWSYALFALYAVVIILDYLMHLSPIIFLVAALGVTGLMRLWLRTTTLRTEIALFVPVIAALAWQFAVANGYREPGDPVASAYFWGTWSSKLHRIGSQFFHYAPRTDLVLFGTLVVAVLARMGLPRWRDLRSQPLVLEMLALGVTFLAMYFVLPLGYSEAYYVDTRPLPLVSFFFIVACLALPRRNPRVRSRREQVALALAVLLAIGNLVYIGKHFLADRAWVEEYRSIAAAVPIHGRVLTVYTRGGEGSFFPFMHAGGFVAMDRAAIEPYVFAGDNGNPMKYFRYKQLPYAPQELWYGEIPRRALDWQKVVRDYDYLLITKPYDPGALLGLAMWPLTENSTATLLEIQK